MTNILQKIEKFQNTIDCTIDEDQDVTEGKKRKLFRFINYIMLAFNVAVFLVYVWIGSFGFGAGFSLATIIWFILVIIYSRLVDILSDNLEEFLNYIIATTLSNEKEKESLILENSKLREKINFLEKNK